jgi:hypothetical protein
MVTEYGIDSGWHGVRARRSVVRCRYLPARPAGVLASFTAASVAPSSQLEADCQPQELGDGLGDFLLAGGVSLALARGEVKPPPSALERGRA